MFQYRKYRGSNHRWNIKIKTICEMWNPAPKIVFNPLNRNNNFRLQRGLHLAGNIEGTFRKLFALLWLLFWLDCYIYIRDENIWRIRNKSNKSEAIPKGINPQILRQCRKSEATHKGPFNLPIALQPIIQTMQEIEAI